MQVLQKIYLKHKDIKEKEITMSLIQESNIIYNILIELQYINYKGTVTKREDVNYLSYDKKVAAEIFNKRVQNFLNKKNYIIEGNKKWENI